jgi:hypothetical protein
MKMNGVVKSYTTAKCFEQIMTSLTQQRDKQTKKNYSPRPPRTPNSSSVTKHPPTNTDFPWIPWSWRFRYYILTIAFNDVPVDALSNSINTWICINTTVTFSNPANRKRDGNYLPLRCGVGRLEGSQCLHLQGQIAPKQWFSLCFICVINVSKTTSKWPLDTTTRSA